MKTLWKIIKGVVYFVVGFLILDLAIIGFFSLYRPALKPVDDIVVLGAAVKTEAAYQRSLEGLKLYQEGLGKAIVVSGGVDYPKGQSEASYMKQTIQANSSSTVPIIVENQSDSTYENLVNTKGLIGPTSSIIIVSDDYHLARAVLMAERLGFKKVYWSSPSPSYYSKTELSFYFFREITAMIDYIPKFVTGK
jgi:uncharacterized SAM-binding protein YcdF (DUF218 family)